MPDRRNATASRAGVLRPEEFAKYVELDRAEVGPDVAHWVENHWGLRWELPAGTSYVSSTLPHPACNLSVERGQQRPELAQHGEGDPVVVTGVYTQRFDVTIAGTGWVHAVKFRPGGLAALVGVRASELRDRTVTAATVLPRATCDRLRRLGPELSPDECREVFEATLAELATQPDPDYDTLLEVIATMLADRALLRVSQVEDATGLGTRSLQRLFQRYVGVSPKWVLSRYRMHDVVTRLDDGYDGSLADLAAEYGWFDQAHFTREFTELIGVPPSGYAQR